MALTKRREVFVESYLRHWNGTKAASEAGFAHPRQEASRLLSNADIQARIAERLSELKMGADEVLTRLADIGRGSPEVFMTFDGRSWVLDIPKAHKEGKLHLIKSIVPTQFGIKVEMHDPVRALELIGKAHRLFVERHEVDANLNITGLDGMLNKVYGNDDDDTS